LHNFFSENAFAKSVLAIFIVHFSSFFFSTSSPRLFFVLLITSVRAMNYSLSTLYNSFQSFRRALIWRMILAFALCAFAEISAARAQMVSPRNETRSSRGREFYITFLPNVHDGGRGTPFLNDSLYIYITSEVPTSGSIRYRNRLGAETSVPFSIPDPNQIFTFRIHYQNFELQGYFTGERFDSTQAQSERVARQFFHVRADDEVTVYGLNQALYTSDAFLALPVESLGREYVVLAYKSDARGLLFMPNSRDEVSTPSQFAVVATQNDTQVEILPSAPTLLARSTNAQVIRLNEGEVYLVQADPRAMNGLGDLTGSRVKANKPVAVFAGHQRTTLPVELRPSLWTRDHLVEQLPGLETWGKSAFITPFIRARDEVGLGTDLFRVVAAYDNTRIFVNGQPLTTLNAGQVFEGPLAASAWITASDQILVAQYKKTSSTLDAKFVGDPFMLLVPQVEQYDRSYRFINVEAFDPINVGSASPSSRGRVFEDHFITIIAPSGGTGLSSLQVDGIPLDPSRFTPIVNSGYSFANFALSPGVHTARGDSAFALYVYGYGVLNSYGYIGGGRLRIIAPDRDAPQIIARAECFGVRGAVFDTALTDSRIARVEFSDAQNVNVSVEAFTPFADSVGFQATLQNVFADGEFTLEARDSIGFVTRRLFRIPGFTVGAEGRGANADAQRFRLTLPTGRSRIIEIPIVNYGSSTQTVSAIDLVNNPANPAPFRILSPQTPFTLSPGGRDTLRVALDATAQGRYAGTLSLSNNCAARALALLEAEAGEDQTPPEISSRREICERIITLNIRDGEPFPSGTAVVEALGELENCVLERPPAPNAFTVTAVLRILNPRLDAVYTIVVRDSAGNETILRDTAQGFTLEIVRAQSETGQTGQWGDVEITGLDCRDIVVRNVGVLPYALERLAPRVNRFFSVVESQFPLVIPARGERAIRLCFAPLEETFYADTLVIERYCETETLLLSGRGEPLTRFQGSRCNAEIRLRTARAPLHYFMEQNYPNPALGGSRTTFVVGLAAREEASLRLFSTLGEEITRVDFGALAAGEHEIALDLPSLPTGLYIAVFQTPTTRMSRHILIAR
jgi:hypothetical protein